MSESSWETLYPGRVPEDGPPSTKECEVVARTVLERGYVKTTVYGNDAGPVRPDDEPTT